MKIIRVAAGCAAIASAIAFLAGHPGKATIFAACMFFAIKWHYDQGKKAKNEASKSPIPTERTPGASE